MEMTIKSALEYLKDFDSYSPYQEAIDKVSTYIEQMQADYENRLKADLEAILVELQLEIEEVARCPYTECVGEDCPFQDCMIHKGRVVGLIQQKINSLKEGKDG